MAKPKTKIDMNSIGFAKLCAAKGKNEADYDVAAAPTYAGKEAVFLKRLRLIASGYNGGKKVKMADTNQRKWYHFLWIEEDETVSGGFRLSFIGSDYGIAPAALGARPYFLKEEDLEPSFDHWKAEFEGFMQNGALALLNEE